MSICTMSTASINVFSKVCSSFLTLGQDPRHDVTIRIREHNIPMLYNTGAAATCPTLDTFLKYFSYAKLDNHQTSIIGAGNNNLKLYGVYTLPASYKGPKATGTIMVWKHLDDNILSIDLINDLGMSYDAKIQQVFCYFKSEGHLGRHRRNVHLTLFHARYMGHIDPYATQLAIVLSPLVRHLQGGPGLVKFNKKSWPSPTPPRTRSTSAKTNSSAG